MAGRTDPARHGHRHARAVLAAAGGLLPAAGRDIVTACATWRSTDRRHAWARTGSLNASESGHGANRSSDAADGRVHRGGHRLEVAEAGRRRVGRDEPLLEISTDKVDAEIPSPAAGTLAEIVVKEGETVEVGTVVAIIETEGGRRGGTGRRRRTGGDRSRKPAEAAAAARPRPCAAEAPRQPAGRPDGDGDGGGDESAEERLRRKSTPLVRRSPRSTTWTSAPSRAPGTRAA
jgi:hypothetical protein